jgi:putative ABC transport system ATP-binding protein
MIELTSLDKTFEQPGGDRVHALRGVNLTIPAGQFLTVIGSNGSGKSTILNVIAGTYFTDTGSIRIANTDVTRWPEH